MWLERGTPALIAALLVAWLGGCAGSLSSSQPFGATEQLAGLNCDEAASWRQWRCSHAGYCLIRRVQGDSTKLVRWIFWISRCLECRS